MKKKLLAFFIASTMVMSVACSDSKDSKKKSKEKDDDEIEEIDDDEEEDKDESNSSKDNDSNKSESKESEVVEVEEDDEDMFTTTYWKAIIPDSFVGDENNYQDGEYLGIHSFDTYDSNGTKTGKLRVYIDMQGTFEYRSHLHEYISVQDQAAGNYETYTIGGLDFITYYDVNTEEDIYLYRAEKTGIVIRISVKPGTSDVDEFFSSMKFDLPDNGYVDAPYPWDGQAIITNTNTVDLDGISLTATQLVADVPMTPWNLVYTDITVNGDTVSAFNGNSVTVYSLNGDSLTYVSEYVLNNTYYLETDDDAGNIYYGGSQRNPIKYTDGELVATFEDIDTPFAISPDGTFGVTYVISTGSMQKYLINEDGTTTLDDSFAYNKERFYEIRNVTIYQDHILVGGYTFNENGDKDKYGVVVYDFNGNEQMMLVADDSGYYGSGMDSIGNVAETDNYFIVLDRSFRNILVWDKEGNWLGTVRDCDVFGTSDYTYLSGLDVVGDTIYVSLMDDRADDSWREMLFYRIDIS